MSAPLVLLVDSHEDSRAIYRIIFEHAGFGVQAAAWADEGLRLAQARTPDLIVLECVPPRGRSVRDVRLFRGDASTARAPLVAISTVPGEADREALLREGISTYLVKPCPPLVLLDAARRLLGA